MNQIAKRRLQTLTVVTAALWFAACGGGDASPPPSPNQTSGFAVDGYLAGASVLCDSNGDGLVTPGEISVTTTSAGLFVFPEGCSAGMVTTGGTNADTGLPFVGMLKGAAGSKVTTPLTTLLVHGLSQDQLNSTLGLPAGTDLANTDPAATDGAGTLLNESLFKKTLAVQQLVQKTSEMLNGLTTPVGKLDDVDKAALPAIYNEVAAAFAEFLKGGARLNLSDTVVDQAVIGQLVNAAALRVAAAPALSAPVRAAAQSVNSQALAGVTAGSLKIQAEALLNASGAAAVKAETLEQQSSQKITEYVSDNRSKLAGSPTAESVNAMSTELTKQVSDSQNTGGGTTPPPAGDGTLLVSFDEDPPVFSKMGAFGGALPTVDPGPAGCCGKALKIVKPTGAKDDAGQVVTWGGVYFNTASIPFTSTRRTITARVYSTRAGAVYAFKVESANGGPAAEVTSTPAGAANTWSTVSWTLSGVDPSKSYTTMVITPDSSITTSGQAYYVDQITLAPTDPVVPPPAGGTDTVLVSFDEPNPGFDKMGAYGGAKPSVEGAPPGGTGSALKILKPSDGKDDTGQVVTWGGTFFTVAPIPFAADRKVITARVNASRAGAVFTFKVESSNGGPAIEIASVPTVAANTWSTVSWDLTGVDLGKSYTTIAITPDLSLTTSGQTYWVDTISLAAASAPPPPFTGVLATFDEPTPPKLEIFGKGAGVEAAAGPTGGSGNAAKFTKSAGDTWAGFWFPTVVMPFTQSDRTITARVYSPKAGAPMAMKVEGPGGAVSGEVMATPATVVGWQTLTWAFSTLDPSKTYNKIVVIPDSGTSGSGQVYYFDDFKFPGGGGAPVGPVTIATLEEPTASLTGFEGCWDSTLVNDPAGGTNKVGKVVKPGSGVPFYCGTTVVTVLNGGFTPIPFTASAQTMTVRVWSPDNVGTPVRLKVEDIADAAKFVEVDALTTVKNGWQTLTFNFAAPAAGSPALNLATTYTKVSIFFDFGTKGTGRTYYFDDVVFVTGTGTNVSVVTFDERNYNNTQSEPSVLKGFGGAENSTLVGTSDGLPAGGGSGKAAKVVKNDGEPWAGTSIQRRANDAVPTIPFATGATKMSVRVYSAYPGVRVHLKVEQSGRPDINSEVNACTTLTNAWETLIFDFGPAGKHFVPGGPCPEGHNTNLPTSQLDVSKVHNKVNIFFDYGLGDAGYDAMPGQRTYYFDEVKFIGK